ncbi:MAG TPA: chalcone isomerase family protein [Candidatus Sulfotelmatobacter sp.]
MSLAIALFGLTSVIHLHAASLAGVTRPDTAQIGSTTLVLNGLGLRTKHMVKVDVAGLYLPQKSSDAVAIFNADVPKRIVMHFLHGASKKRDERCIRRVVQRQYAGWEEDDAGRYRTHARRAGARQGRRPDGLHVRSGTGTTLAINGNDKMTIAGPAFGRMLFSVWLGPKPPNAGLKKGILGQ